MNPPGSREELEGMGFVFERRTKCGGNICGATIEYWRKVPGPQIPFRVDARTGKLIQHADECPNAKQFRQKPAQEKLAKQGKAVKQQAEKIESGRLF